MSFIQQPTNSDPLDYAASHTEAVQRVNELLQSVRDNRTGEQREQTLDELLALHEQLQDEGDEKGAREAEITFLLLLRDDPSILKNTIYRSFVADSVDRKSFYELRWESVEEVIMVAEVLYGFRDREAISSDEITTHVRDLVRHALRQYEREDAPEKMFDLLQRAPIPASMMDAELVRLRNRLHLYEMRRVQRKQRFLYAYLGVQILLVFVIFPLLFQNVENGQLQKQVEETTGWEIVDGQVQCSQTDGELDCQREPEYQFLSLGDSLYWSVITYGSIGYGDVSPLTNVGKTLAGIHGLMGVLTTGIIAGLILNWISPRSLTT